MKEDRKVKKQRDNNDYIEKLRERHNHLYGLDYEEEEKEGETGEDTQEDLPPILDNIERPKLIGWTMVIFTGVIGIVMANIFISGFAMNQIVPFSFAVVFCYGFLTLGFIGGWRMIKKSTSKEAIKKTLIQACAWIAAISLLVILLNATVLKKTSTITENIIQHRMENGKEYIVVRDGQLKLKCSSTEISETMSIVISEKGKAVFGIQYEWNVLSPRRGRVIDITREE